MPAIRQKQQSSPLNPRKYQRYAKPPYSYVGMVIVAIESSPCKKLTLSEILQELQKMFPFFTQEYKGWKDSVRHNLSNNDCFVKILRDGANKSAKRNFWAVNRERIPFDAYRRQETVISRKGSYAVDLRDEVSKYWSKSATELFGMSRGSKEDVPSDSDCTVKSETLTTVDDNIDVETVCNDENVKQSRDQCPFDRDVIGCDTRCVTFFGRSDLSENQDKNSLRQSSLSFSIENILSDKFKGRSPTTTCEVIPELNAVNYRDTIHKSYTDLFVNNVNNNTCRDTTDYCQFHIQAVPLSRLGPFQTMPRPIMSPQAVSRYSAPLSSVYNPLEHFADYVLTYS